MKQKKDVKNKAGKICAALLVSVAGVAWIILANTTSNAQNPTSTNSEAVSPTAPAAVTPPPAATNPVPAESPAPTTTTTSEVTKQAAPEAAAPATTTETAPVTTSAPAAKGDAAPLSLPAESSTSSANSVPATDSTGNSAAAAADQNAVQPGVGGIGVDNYYAPSVAAKDEQTRLPVLFSLDFQTIYDDNIYITRDGHKADMIYRTTPKIVFESTRLEKWERSKSKTKSESTKVGDDEAQSSADEEETQPENYFRASYAAIWQKYNKYFTNDSLDHSAQVFYRHNSEKSLLELSQTFTTYDGPNVDVQGTLQQTTYGTRVFGSYAVASKTTLELEVVQTDNRYDVGFNADETAISPYINYEISPKLTLGVGTIVDFLYISSGINQTSQQPNLRAVYKYSDKLSITARAGFEIREFAGYNYERKSPMFSLGSQWTPFEHTSVNIDGYRRTAPSIGSANQDYDATGLAVQLRQVFLTKYFAALRGTFEHANYFYGSNGLSSGRKQDYYSVRPSIGYMPNDMLTFSVYYQYSENIASPEFNKFRDNQIGFQGSFSY